MAKTAERMGMEKLCWEIVRIEHSLQACEMFKRSILQLVEQTPRECSEVSAAIMRTIRKLETDYRKRMARLEMEQARRERELGI
jgi:DNA repair ATPase RecN